MLSPAPPPSDDMSSGTMESSDEVAMQARPIGYFMQRPAANHIRPLGGDEASIGYSEEGDCPIDLYAPPEDLAFALYG